MARLQISFNDSELPNSSISELECATDAECAGLKLSVQAIPPSIRARSRLQTIFSDNGYPQILLLLGYAKDIEPTQRRTADEVLNNS